MERVQYTTQLDFTDNGTFETGWRIKQGDFGNCELIIRLVNNGVNAYDASIIPQIVFRRADGQSVISVMIPNDGTYKYIFVGNELEVPGFELVDVKYQDSEGRISTASCRFTVVEDTIGYDPTGAHTYDNPVSELVEQATEAAETAIDSSFKSEGWAVGEQGGEPVGPDSPYYHNNAKWYAELNSQKSDISAIGTDESGRTTASKAYTIGKHFYKDGKFCTAIASISSGATLTLNTNYVEGTIADALEVKDVTSEFTFNSDCSWNTGWTKIYKYGKLIKGNIRLSTPSTMTSDKIIISVPTKYKSKNTNCFLGTIVSPWTGQYRGCFGFSGSGESIRLMSTAWATDTAVVASFEYLTD